MVRPTPPGSCRGRATLAEFDPSLWWRGRADSPGGAARTSSTPGASSTEPAAQHRRGHALARPRGAAGRGQVDRRQPARRRAAARPHRAEGRRQRLQHDARAELDGNTLDAEGRLGAAHDGADDRWTLTLDAPGWPLSRRWRAWAAATPQPGSPARSTHAWRPAAAGLRSPRAARARAASLRAGIAATAQRRTARWQAGTALDAPVDAEAELAGLALGPARIESARLRAQGSGRAHRLELNASSNARPPGWADALLQAAANDGKGATQALLIAQGGFVAGSTARAERLARHAAAARRTPRRLRRGVAGEPRHNAGTERIGNRAGATARSRAAPRCWARCCAGSASPGVAAQASAAARIEAEAELELLAVAPLLQRLQPEFGWGGDLRLRGRLALHSAPNFTADIVIERERGDLNVTDETGTQSLGLTDLRLGLAAADGTWSFTRAWPARRWAWRPAPSSRASPQATWPAPDTPVSGVLELQVANLGTWGTWVPAGWRLGGALRVSAGISGRFGAPEYTGRVDGRELSVRNFLQGVNVHDGEVAIALQGDPRPRRTLQRARRRRHAEPRRRRRARRGAAGTPAARGAALPAARAHRPAHRHQRQRADAAGERTGCTWTAASPSTRA